MYIYVYIYIYICIFIYIYIHIYVCIYMSENPNLRLRSRLELWSLSWHRWQEAIRWRMGWRRPRRAYWRTSVSINSDSDSEQKSSELVALRCAFPQLQHDGIAVRHHISTDERKSSRRAWVQEELNMIHYARAAACLFTRLRAEELSDFNEAHCGVASRERPYEIVTYLYVCEKPYDCAWGRARTLTWGCGLV